MLTRLTVEKWSEKRQAWRRYGTILLELPFTATGRLNLALETTVTLDGFLCQNICPVGLYRIGEDDAAILDWDGGSARAVRRPPTIVNVVEMVLSRSERKKESGVS